MTRPRQMVKFDLAHTEVRGFDALTKAPSHWDVLRIATLFRESQEMGQDGLPVLSVSINWGISDRELNDDDRHRIVNQIDDKNSYKRVRPGDLVYNMMRAWQGALGVAKLDGLVSPAYVVARPTRKLHAPYFEYLLRTPIWIEDLRRASKGIADFRQRLYWEHFRQVLVLLPPLSEQMSIADFLGRETARINRLIEKKRLFGMSVACRIEALVDQAISDANVPRIRFEHLTQRVSRPVTLSEHDELVRLGLYNRGRGIFKKPAADEEGMGDSEFFFVESGDLILSGQFAWEGAAALATAEEEGCVVSHRYPVYRGKSGVNTSYLLGLLRSSYGDFLLNEASRGSAGRNRPLNVRRLGKEKIPVPGSELQKAVEQAVDFERRLKRKTEQSIARLEEFRTALITAVVTGQIDVTTWGKQGQTDRRLERIEEAMRA